MGMGSIPTTSSTTTKERIAVGASEESLQSYKAVGLVVRPAQSVLNSLLASLLLSLVNFWDWLASRLKINYWGHNKQQSNSIFCANVNTNMTIEVSKVTEAMVNPDHEQNEEVVVDNQLGTSLPTVLRLNSESFEYNSEEEILLEFNQEANSNRNGTEEVFSDYCSGSGSGSPTPNEQHGEDEDEQYQQEKDLDNNSECLDRRDSGASVSSAGEESGSTEVSPEMASRIVSQVEVMFSDDHLTKDGFLLKHVRRRSDGFVSLKLVAGLRKVKQISREFPVVLTSLRQSDKLEVNTDGTKIRRKEPLTNVLKSLPIKQAKKEKSQSEKENQGGTGNHSSTDEQQIIRGSPANYLSQKSSPPNATDGFLRPKSNSYGGGTNASVGFLRPKSNSYCGGNNPSATSRNPWNQRRKGSAASVTSPRSSNGEIVIPGGIRQPSAALGFLRPKSNSYCEGANTSMTTMSPWLQRRKASVASSRLSNGEIVISGVIRQPRGPDGTKGFQPGYRMMILEERLQNQITSQST